MTYYRIYTLSDDGTIRRPPQMVELSMVRRLSKQDSFSTATRLKFGRVRA